MPLYEYECKKCHHRFEKIQKFSDPHVKKCPECGGPIEQVISAPAVQFNRYTGPQQVFFRLGLTEKDGWTPPKDYKQFPEAASRWLKDHADTYRIQRFVAEEKKSEKK